MGHVGGILDDLDDPVQMSQRAAVMAVADVTSSTPWLGSSEALIFHPSRSSVSPA